MTNNEQLLALMKDYNLGRRDVARLVDKAIAHNGQCYSVNNWLSAFGSTTFRRMPTTALSLLTLRLQLATPEQRASFEGPLDKAAVLAENRKKRKCFQNVAMSA